MLSNPTDKAKTVTSVKPAERIIIDLQYLTADQATHLIKMFDSPEAYAENFSTIKAIASGLFKLILETKPQTNSPIGRIFHTVNEMQGTLMLDDMQEHRRIITESGLMPDPWDNFRSREGGSGC